MRFQLRPELSDDQRLKVVSMSCHLIRQRAFTSEQEAIRSLSWRYGLDDVAALAGEALALARATLKVAA